ncbi:MAG: MarR family transcriptional regulator, partial [Caldilineaceae bacterium]|nr:MarR family transcriptional regulator [Caldilineaceae bacterium]
EMAARAQMTHQSMSELVTSLEQQGYVEYQPDPRDRRAKLVCLTDAGRAMLRVSLAEIATIEAAWRDRLRAQGIEGDLGAALAALLEETPLAVQ